MRPDSNPANAVPLMPCENLNLQNRGNLYWFLYWRKERKPDLKGLHRLTQSLSSQFLTRMTPQDDAEGRLDIFECISSMCGWEESELGLCISTVIPTPEIKPTSGPWKKHQPQQGTMLIGSPTARQGIAQQTMVGRVAMRANLLRAHFCPA